MKLARLLALLLLPLTTGCYLSHLADGQLRLIRASKPVEEVLADPETPPVLREKLGLVEEARRFASELGLEVDDQYTRYAAWQGDRVVTTVVATEPGSVEPQGFWFPIVGTVPYKGEVAKLVINLMAGLKSGMSYSNATTIPEFWDKAEFVKVTPTGVRENLPHATL